jgi:dienelactone hydrolase
LSLISAARGETIEKNGPLADMRARFQTTLTKNSSPGPTPDKPPAEMFDLVQYESPVGKLWAYVSHRSATAAKGPAIVWLTGGFDNDIGDTSWTDAPPSNDQSARAFREAGIIMMYPSLRGGNDNPGHKEAFYGEVDDVIAATNFLATQPFVDASHIYLGGHSTGGTLALLTAECAKGYRAVFAFGPVDEVVGYGAKNLPFALFPARAERSLRSPGEWLTAIQDPVFMFEGDRPPSNIASVTRMAKSNSSALLHTAIVPGESHFSILSPETKIIAAKILADHGDTTSISFNSDGK